jgi:hypothetical protein
LSLTTLTACGSGAGKGSNEPPSTVGSPAKLQERSVDEQPEVAVIVRSGDPRAGLSFVIGNDASLEDSLLLSALLTTRLEKRSLRFDVRLSLDIISIVGALETIESVKPIVRAVDECIRAEIGTKDVAVSAFVSNYQRLRQLYRAEETALERRGCLGELDVSSPVEPSVNGEMVKRLERLRRRLYTVKNAHWGVVGSETMVGAVVEALKTVPPWPTTRVTMGRWPTADGVALVKASSNRCSLVVRTNDAEQAFALSRAVNSEQGETFEILSGRFPGYRVVQSHPTAMTRGGCLRVEIEALQRREAPAISELLSVTRVISDAIRQRVPQGHDTRLTKGLAALEQPEPISASMLAGEVSLSTAETVQPERFFLQIQTESVPEGTTLTQKKFLDELLGVVPERTKLPVLTRVESGQGKMYALLASSCVPPLEPKRLVGSSSLFLSAMASRYSGVDGVTLQPWISAEGGGLFAFTGKRYDEETTRQQAERLGRALGRAATSLIADNDAFWQQRAARLFQLGPGPRPALWHAIQSLAPEHPGLVAPEGVYSTIESIAPLELRERQLLWQSQGLRLAVVLSDSANEAESVARAISRWGLPLQGSLGNCTLEQVEPPAVGSIEVENARGNSGDASIALSIALPAGDGLPSVYAYWLLRLLTQPNGLLEKLSYESGVPAQFDATVVGGPKRRGIVFVVGAPAAQTETALDALKKLFEAMANGSKPDELGYSKLESWFREREYARRSDPRQRLIELWTYAGRTPETSESSFRAYLRRAFTDGQAMVVRATSKPEKSQVEPKNGVDPTSSKSRRKGKSAL